MITFFVDGQPQPGGSKNAFPIRRLDGTVGVRVIDANPKASDWKKVVKDTASVFMKANGINLLEGPIKVYFDFCMLRPRRHYNKNMRLMKTAPKYPTCKPDVLKLARSTEDALTGILWHDDAQTVVLNITKRYADMGEPVGVRITAGELSGDT